MHMSMSISIWLVSLAVGFPQEDLSSDEGCRTGRDP